MARLVVVAAVVVAWARAAEAPGPSEFHVVSEFFSDYGPALYYRIIDVVADGPDTIVRYVRIAPVDLACPRTIVQAVERRVTGRSPAQLADGNNPCAINPAELRAAQRKYSRFAGAFETISFGVTARCGASAVTLELPRRENLDLKKMKAHYPAMVRIRDLGSDLADAVFGAADIFHHRSEADDLALQSAGEEMLPRIVSGRYDAALTAAVGASATFRAVLENYRGPITAAQVKERYRPRLLDATSYRFARYVAPEYPPLAKQARVEGKVEIQLSVSPGGDVEQVLPLSGHPLLTPSAVKAAQAWRFEPGSVATGVGKATIEILAPLRAVNRPGYGRKAGGFASSPISNPVI